MPDDKWVSEAGWRLTPDSFAHKLSGGKFQRYDHIRYIGEIIAGAVFGGDARIILSVPPRHGKSWLVSKWTPAWFLSWAAHKNIILASYEADFAAHWGRETRAIVREHQDRLGFQLNADSKAASRWQTNQGGGMITAGVGGPITGRGGDLIIVDDPVKNWKEAMSETTRKTVIDWWKSTLYTRLEPGASIIVLMTRWHEMDLAGFLLSADNEAKEDWREIKIPAISEENDPLGRPIGAALCPERYDEAALAKIKRNSGSRVWNALYQQRPSAQEGNIIFRKWIQYYTSLPERFDEEIISVDATFTGKATSDFVAMQVWGRYGSKKFLLDQVYERMGITATIHALEELSARHPKATLKLVENKANGPAIEDLLKDKLSGIVLWEPQGDKVSRAYAVTPQYEAGNVFYPSPDREKWVKDLVEEVTTFPNASHDDRTDAMTMALLRLEENASRGAGTIRVVRR